jgi:hypothetical protein
MRCLIIIFIILANLALIDQPVLAQEFQFTIPNNHISFKSVHFLTNTLTNNRQVSAADPINVAPSQKITINDSYTLDLTNEALEFLTFEYLLESEEQLLAFDEPAFYVAVENDKAKTIIFAKTAKQSHNSWQQVILDLRDYDLANNSLVFYAGNLGDEEKNTAVHLRNLFRSIADIDQSFLSNRNLGQKITDLALIREFDESLTLLFAPVDEIIFSNHQYFITCGDVDKQLLTQHHYYLLPHFVIQGFWPNMNDKILINIQDFVCDDLNQVSLELI